MFRTKRSRSARLGRKDGSRVNIVNLKLDNIQQGQPPANTLLPAKFEIYIRQHEYEQRVATGTGTEERFHAEDNDDNERKLARYPSDNALNEACNARNGHPHLTVTFASDILISQTKANRLSRRQTSLEADVNQPFPVYRPISSHQYLTSTELKEDALQDIRLHLGRPTRTTLLRDKQRRRSVTAISTGRELQQKSGQRQEQPRPATRYEAVTNILYAMIPPGQSLHGFLSGARYNKANWIESLGSLDLASDLPEVTTAPSNVPANQPAPASEQQDDEYMPRAPPDSPVDMSCSPGKDGSSSALFPLLNVEATGVTLKQNIEGRSFKVAWEDKKRSSPLPDRARHETGAHEKVRFSMENVGGTGGGTSHVSHPERAQFFIRPSSVRGLPPSHNPRSARDMDDVIIHGTSLHGKTTPTQLQSDLESGMRRSWSAMSYNSSASKVPEALNRLNPLKVTGMKVTAVLADAGKPGMKSATPKSGRVEVVETGVKEGQVRSCYEKTVDDDLDPERVLSAQNKVVIGGLEPNMVVGDLDPTMIVGDLNSNVNAGDLDPTMIVGDLDSNVNAGDLDPNMIVGDLDPDRSVGDLDPNRFVGDLDPTMIVGDLDSNVNVGDLDPNMIVGDLDPDRSVADLDSGRAFAEDIDPDKEVVLADEFETVDVIERPIPTEESLKLGQVDLDYRSGKNQGQVFVPDEPLEQGTGPPEDDSDDMNHSTVERDWPSKLGHESMKQGHLLKLGQATEGRLNQETLEHQKNAENGYKEDKVLFFITEEERGNHRNDNIGRHGNAPNGNGKKASFGNHGDSHISDGDKA